MRIGFFGNSNNYPFMLARALRKIGHEVLFIVNSKTRLNRPENRYGDISDPYPDWIQDVGQFEVKDYVLPTSKRQAAVRLLQSCNAVILNENGPALRHLVHRPAIIILTGSDLEYYANFNSTGLFFPKASSPTRLLRRLIGKCMLYRLIAAQRAGIRSAQTVNYFARGLNPAGDALLDGIKVQDRQRVFFMITDLERIRLAPPPNNRRVRVFCGTRLSWYKPNMQGESELDYKASDVMIRGLGMFIRDKGIPLDIRLVKKGIHVSESIALVHQEGLDNYVTWLDEMSQEEVLEEFKHADIVFEQFGKSPLGMAGLDAMATGRPVIANAHPEVFDEAMGATSPICQARTPEEVSGQLTSLVFDPVERERVGHASREYAEKFFSADRAANICINRLKGCINGAG
jgi:glycosyltransferase involved in cell wall biosynthesis